MAPARLVRDEFCPAATKRLTIFCPKLDIFLLVQNFAKAIIVKPSTNNGEHALSLKFNFSI
jgi:hypothetical protein